MEAIEEGAEQAPESGTNVVAGAGVVPKGAIMH